MKLCYFRGENGITNFGDELNRDLWPHFLPGRFDDEDESTQFVGIGTLLNDRLSPAPRTIVFGSGVGYFGPPQRDSSWEIYCVRGPLSARALGLDPGVGVTDPAALIARCPAGAATGERHAHAFMPHWQSEPDEWRRVCAYARIGFIDPRWPPAAVLEAMRKTDVLIAEAMHGAIVADALRIPWIPVRTRPRIQRFKWEDWGQSLGLEYQPHDLPTIWPMPSERGHFDRARRHAKRLQATWQLKRIIRNARPVLSRTDVFESKVGQLEDRLDRLKRRDSYESASDNRRNSSDTRTSASTTAGSK